LSTGARLCPECDQPVEGRRTRHVECKRRAHARAMRDHRAAGPVSAYDGEHLDDGREPIDYTLPGAAKPRSVDVIRRPAPERTVEPAISDGRTPSPIERDRAMQVDMSPLPNWLRRDFVSAHRQAASLRQDTPASEPDTWETRIHQRAAEEATMVEFRAPDKGPVGGYDALGRPYPRQRRWG
jgi:hypothetical protein